ncbi:pleckstrin homology domain-containing protein [Ditylenchus destructor]|uniref:Pleckstrin homology domain-containing protein n=1 Tax=Ditylenchus destructor TaxID=166010 RepID=A0AAD4MP67_9BILA|nr:pleckstrin homology domain-containing protein [Ditylenchus destructor]
MDEWCSSLPSSSNSAEGSVHSGQVGIEDHKISDSDSFLYSQRMLQTDFENFKRIVQNAPPGCLALCVILGYTRPGKDNRPTNIRLKEIQAESPLRLSVWPTVMAQIAMSLIQVLGIHEESKCKSNRDLCRLMLKLEQPFYELFNVVMDLFSRTWREMHANVDDLQKVLSVVHDQFERAMATNPNSLEELDKLLQKKLSYFNMQKLWERERIEQEVLELNSATIQSLREYLRPSIEQLVMRRKKNFLKKGMVFTGKHSASGKLSQLAKDQQLWYWELEENERHLCYMDCKVGGKQKELDFSSQKKVVIANIRRIIYGQEYNNRVHQRFDIKLSSKKNQLSSLLKCGLCIEINEDIRNTNNLDEEYYLSTNNESELTAFLDGLQCLINPDVALQTPAMKAEIESLLNLEVRVRLLDMPQRNTASDIPIPPLPMDFSWIPADKFF